MVQNLIREVFLGYLMSDGYRVYRHYRRRLRCWAHYADLRVMPTCGSKPPGQAVIAGMGSA